MEDGFVGSIAQRLEQGTHNPLVPGSNPGGPIFVWDLCLMNIKKHSPVVDKKVRQGKVFRGKADSRGVK